MKFRRTNYNTCNDAPNNIQYGHMKTFYIRHGGFVELFMDFANQNINFAEDQVFDAAGGKP